jgi:integrase
VENRLTHIRVVQLKSPGIYPDGGGLFLQITVGKDGSPRKSWLYRFSIDSRPRHMGLGRLAEVSLAEARAARDEARRKVRQGIDPIEARRIPVAVTKAMTFDQCAAAYIESHRHGWRSTKHQREWATTLAAYASPVFGAMPIDMIETGLVMRALDPIWKSMPETASRLRGRIESVLAWATARKYCEGPNPAQWRNHLDQLLPAPRKVRPVRHMAALPYSEIPALMARLREIDTVPAQALAFTILTAARAGEVLGMTWQEIDLEARVWTVPAARMKANREHRVPLSDAPLAIVLGMSDRSGFVFPGERTPMMYHGAMRDLLAAMGVKATVHGFRSSFRDWAGNETNFPREICEAALAHATGNATEAAYRRSDALEKRRALMQAWSAFVCYQSSPPWRGD